VGKIMITVNATNLIGDTLYTLRPIEQWITLKNIDVNELTIVAHPGLAYEMMRDTFPLVDVVAGHHERPMSVEDVEMRLSAGDSGKWCFERMRGSKGPHISEGYAALLGIEFQGTDISPLTHWVRSPTYDRTKREYILFCPFSSSCSRHTTGKANKTLDDWKWEPLRQYYSKFGMEIKILGAPGERLQGPKFSEDQYYSAKYLVALESIMKKAALVVTLDNGMLHVASALRVPTIALWPPVSCIDFIAPGYTPTTRFTLMQDVNKITPAILLSSLRVYTREILGEE
jgi:hypothetical protein